MFRRFGPSVKQCSFLEGKNLKGLLPEFPGVEAPGWNICVADAAKMNRWVQITLDGKSNKEPDWMFTGQSAGQ